MKYILGLIVLLVVGGGAYYYFSMMPAAPAPQASNQDEQTPPPTDQVQGQDVTVGTGAEATPGSVVTLEYEGRFEDGTVFDSSVAHGQPLVFQLGAEGIIPGFQIGVNGMKVGGERLILIPPSLAYGTQDVKDANGTVLIPANSTLLFSLKLVKVEAAPPVEATESDSGAKTPTE